MTPTSARSVIGIFQQPGERRQRRIIAKLATLGTTGRDLLITIYRDSTSIEARRWAVHGLGNFNQAPAKRIIKVALSDPAMSVRLHALRAVAALGDRRLASAARRLLTDASGGIRINALDVVVGLRAPGYRQAIIRCLTDEKAYLRQRAGFYQAHLRRSGKR